MERFRLHIGMNISPEYICGLSDEELISEIEQSDFWEADLIRDLVWRASFYDETIEDEFDELWDTHECDPGYFCDKAMAILKKK